MMNANITFPEWFGSDAVDEIGYAMRHSIWDYGQVDVEPHIYMKWEEIHLCFTWQGMEFDRIIIIEDGELSFDVHEDTWYALTPENIWWLLCSEFEERSRRLECEVKKLNREKIAWFDAKNISTEEGEAVLVVGLEEPVAIDGLREMAEGALSKVRRDGR